ncbi:MAG: S41 family peptidase [Bacteroidota bacterium]
MGKIATLTKDHHTKVIAPDGSSRQYRRTPSAEDVINAYKQQTEIESQGEYINLFFATNYDNITDSLLNGEGQKVLNDKIEWGSINEKVGYIHIHSFAGFLSSDFSRKQQVDSIRKHMSNIIYNLQSKDAIIVDVSFNFGGYDGATLTVAGFFTDQAVFAYKSQVYNNGSFHDEDNVIVYPSDSMHYIKPVYFLMTDISRSAAENFGMMMDALPNVTLVGTPTLGIQSGMLGKSISNFYTTYSNQRLINSHGAYFEVTGLIPEIELTVFDKNDIMNGHKNAVRKVVDMIEK